MERLSLPASLGESPAARTGVPFSLNGGARKDNMKPKEEQCPPSLGALFTATLSAVATCFAQNAGAAPDEFAPIVYSV